MMRRATLGLLLVTCLAGCQDSSDPPLLGFRATVGDDGRTVLELDGPVTTMDRDGTLRQAYRLVEQRGNANPTIWYLDATFHVVRLDFECGHNDCAHYTTRVFFAQGRLAPYGIGLDHLRASGELVDWSGRQPVAVASDFEGGNRLTIHPQAQYRAGTYHYPGGRLLPDGPTPVASYEARAPLGAADVWPIDVALPTAAAPSMLLFPEADQDVFGVGASPVQWLKALRAENDDADNILATGGCISEFEQPLYGGLSSGPLATPSSRARFVLLDSNGREQEFEVSYTTNLLGQRDYEVTTGTIKGRDDLTCADIARSPEPMQTPTSFLARVDALALSTQGRSSFGFLYTPLEGRPPEASIARYALSLIPAHVNLQASSVSFLAYSVEVDPWTGWFEGIRAAPGDLP